MSHYKSTSRARTFLRHLVDHGPTGFDELLQLLRHPECFRRRQNKAKGILGALCGDRFIRRLPRQVFVVTDEGRAALTELEAGDDVFTSLPAVRVFERAA